MMAILGGKESPDTANRLTPGELESHILRALQLSGRTVLLIPSAKPKPMRVILGGLGGEAPTVLRIYGWNITHGGGAARAPDEYRIQLTGEMPMNVFGEVTVVLGWSTKYNVFAGWDAEVHGQKLSKSPSLQVREATLVSAREDGLAAAARDSDDVVVSFREEMLATYCLNAEALHNEVAIDMAALLNAIPAAAGGTSELPSSGTDGEPRKRVARVVESNFRAWDFGNRVKAAYGDRCAVCSIQLALTEAAHIVPVAWAGSTDETSNGIALCRNHHRAYDANLLSVAPDYRVEVSKSRGSALTEASLDGGWNDLFKFDGKPLAVLPEDPSERPKPAYLETGRVARQWKA